MLVIIGAINCASCSLSENETTQNRVHYFSKSDTIFLFPYEYRDTGYKNRDLEYESKWLSFFNENKLYDVDSLKQYIRLSYWRSFHDPLIIRLEQNKAVVKSAGLEALETHYDSTMLTENELELLEAYHSYGENFDSPNIRNQLVTRYPAIRNDRQKVLYLEFIKSQFPKADSLVYAEEINGIKESNLNEFFMKLDSINFWSMDREYSESDTDGSSFVLEAKNGDKYRIVQCTNCVVLDLIHMRNDLLKFTDLKKDKIY